MSKLEIIKEENPHKNSFDNSMAVSWVQSAIEWVQENRQKVLWGVFFFFLIMFLLFRLFSGSQAKAEKDFIEAKELSKTLLSSEQTQSDVKKLKPLLARRPELHQEFDGILSQAFLNLGETASSEKYYAKVQKRIQEPSAKPALQSGSIALVAKNSPQEAYDQALKLKSELDDPLSSLYTYNLIHIWFLEKTLNKSQEEAKSLEGLIALYKKGGQPARVIESISGDGPSFISYLKERLITLNQ